MTTRQPTQAGISRLLHNAGDWTDPDGCTNCMADTSAVYAPHQPKDPS